MAVIRILEKPFLKKEKTCCCVVFAWSAKTTQQQIILPIFRIAEHLADIFELI